MNCIGGVAAGYTSPSDKWPTRLSKMVLDEDPITGEAPTDWHTGCHDDQMAVPPHWLATPLDRLLYKYSSGLNGCETAVWQYHLKEKL